MKIVIAGGTGFVGSALVSELLSHGHQVIILTRKAPALMESNPRFVEWDNLDNLALIEKELDGTDFIINLAGESINSGRWTAQRKTRILQSRLNATNAIIKLITHLKNKPKALINASAIGFYGTSEQAIFTENHTLAGSDFLASTVVGWEEAAKGAELLGVRTALCRFGVILAKDEGALPRMALPYKLFVGGTVASGKQWVSWIHIADVVKGILFVMNNEGLRGPINFTSPNPVKMGEFGKTLGKALRRPHWFGVPAIGLRILLGEMSSLVVQGQQVKPEKLLEHHYPFIYSDLAEALKNIYNNKY